MSDLRERIEAAVENAEHLHHEKSYRVSKFEDPRSFAEVVVDEVLAVLEADR